MKMLSINFNNYWLQVQTWLNTMSLRERALVAITLIALTWSGWLNSVGGDVIDSKARVERDIARLAADLKMEVVERQRLQAIDNKDYKTLLSQRDVLSESVQERQRELENLLNEFIAPRDVPNLLEDILRQHRGLRLVKLESLEPQGLLADSDDAEQIFRHPIRLQLEGGYLDTYAYLVALEGSRWQLGWRRLAYTVQDYPTATITIEVETLSRDKDFLGV
jgi:MSHA biogenesis protein MshJ